MERKGNVSIVDLDKSSDNADWAELVISNTEKQ